jgi:hypothetical protein
MKSIQAGKGGGGGEEEEEEEESASKRLLFKGDSQVKAVQGAQLVKETILAGCAKLA